MERVAASGRKRTVLWGTAQAHDFFQELSEADQAKVVTIFQLLADHGEIRSEEKFRKVESDLWEFKSHQIRLLGDFRPGGQFVVVLGLKKQRDRHKRKNLKKAHQLLEDYDQKQRT